MPERVADAIEEIARPNRDEQQEKPHQADPARRRPRLIRNAPAAVVAGLVLAAAVAAGWATWWLLGLPAVSDRLPVVPRPTIRIAAAVIVAAVAAGLIAWICQPAQTLRRGVRDWAISARRWSARIPLFGALHSTRRRSGATSNSTGTTLPATVRRPFPVASLRDPGRPNLPKGE